MTHHHGPPGGLPDGPHDPYQAPGQPTPVHPFDPARHQQALAQDAEKAKKLLRASRLLALAGLVLWLPGGCTVAVLLEAPGPGIALGGLGFLLLVAGAVVGQIARGMQGRVI